MPAFDHEIVRRFKVSDRLRAETPHLRLERAKDALAHAVEVTGDEWFVPSSMLAQLRRDGVAALDEVRRNLDHAFEQLLERPSADRRVPLSLRFSADADCLQLELRRPSVESHLPSAKNSAEMPLCESWCGVTVRLDGRFERAQNAADDRRFAAARARRGEQNARTMHRLVPPRRK